MKHCSPRRSAALVLLAFVCAIAAASAQHDPRALQGVTTTDDPRRVPIPARDTSKDPVLVLRHGILLAAAGAAPVADAVVVVKGNRIIAAGPRPRVQVPDRVDRELDVRGLYIVPGLIDLHMHFTQQWGDDFGMYRDSDAASAIRGVEKLGRFLDGGITAVRDVGTRNDVAPDQGGGSAADVRWATSSGRYRPGNWPIY